jgi:hypothetical protein
METLKQEALAKMEIYFFSINFLASDLGSFSLRRNSRSAKFFEQKNISYFIKLANLVRISLL